MWNSRNAKLVTEKQNGSHITHIVMWTAKQPPRTQSKQTTFESRSQHPNLMNPLQVPNKLLHLFKKKNKKTRLTKMLSVYLSYKPSAYYAYDSIYLTFSRSSG